MGALSQSGAWAILPSMRRLLVAAIVIAGMTATASSAATPHVTKGPLTGTWKGVLTGTRNGATRQEPLTITINNAQTAGTWKVSPGCKGTLTLDGISGGSHHYLRHVSSTSTCHPGDIDCLWPGKTAYDNVTPRPNGWNRSGTLYRVTTT
jgi:hypothetical protein